MYDKEDVYIKDNKGRFVSLGTIKAGRILLDNGATLTIGKDEDLFTAKLSDSDRSLLGQMNIGV